MKKIKDSNSKYHSSKAISSSALKTIYKSSIKSWLKLKVKPTKAMGFGTAVHTALLEPDKFYTEIAVKPKDIDRRTKAGKELYKEFVEKSEGKTIIDADEYNLIEQIKIEVSKHKYITDYLIGEKELSHYGKFMDIDCRCRPDVINYENNFITDVKTCQDTHPAAFTRDCYKWAYHLQAAFYSDFCGIDANNFRFIVIMSKMVDDMPFADVQLISMDSKLIEAGRIAYKEAINRFKFYKETKIDNILNWPYINNNDESLIIKGYGKN